MGVQNFNVKSDKYNWNLVLVKFYTEWIAELYNYYFAILAGLVI
jgi:hypothetical protein